jgi:hypothetical protein
VTELKPYQSAIELNGQPVAAVLESVNEVLGFHCDFHYHARGSD